MKNLFLFILTALSLTVYSQELTLSPYSRYGVGEIFERGSARSFGMGNTGIGAFSNNSINRTNPASYADLKLTTIHVSGFAEGRFVKSDSAENNMHTEGLNQIMLAFPGNNNFGLVVGLAPYSGVGYEIHTFTDVLVDTVMQEYRSIYSAKGGLNQLFIGAGFGVGKHFRFGADLAYTFGTTEYIWDLDFNSDDYRSVNIYKTYRMRGFSVRAGAQYLKDLEFKKETDKVEELQKDMKALDRELSVQQRIAGKKPNKKNRANIDLANYKINQIEKKQLYLTNRMKYFEAHPEERVDSVTKVLQFRTGLIFEPPLNLTSFRTFYFNTADGQTVLGDTVEDDVKGTVAIPLRAGIGFSLTSPNAWMAAVDFSWQNWDDFTFYGQPGNLTNSFRVSAGMERIPDYVSRGLFRRIAYRGGLFYHSTYYEPNNTPITEYGISLGAGIPLGRGQCVDYPDCNEPRQYSTINIGVMAGTRGETSNNLLQETFIRMQIGINLLDKWFVKPEIE